MSNTSLDDALVARLLEKLRVEPSEHLREMLGAPTAGNWSAEAQQAARQLLEQRARGAAPEPFYRTGPGAPYHGSPSRLLRTGDAVLAPAFCAPRGFCWLLFLARFVGRADLYPGRVGEIKGRTAYVYYYNGYRGWVRLADVEPLVLDLGMRFYCPRRGRTFTITHTTQGQNEDERFYIRYDDGQGEWATPGMVVCEAGRCQLPPGVKPALKPEAPNDVPHLTGHATGGFTDVNGFSRVSRQVSIGVRRELLVTTKIAGERAIMGVCMQCGRAASFWRRDLWTGLCRRCVRRPGQSARETLLRRAGIVAVVLFACVFASLFYFTPLFDINRSFSSDEWLRGNLRDRGRMVRDLASPERLPGDLPSPGKLRAKNRDKVHELLGPPDTAYGGHEEVYKVDIGYRWINGPRLHELHVLYEKDGETVACIWID